MQLKNCNASCSVKVFLWVNLTLEDKTPLLFYKKKKKKECEWLILSLQEKLCRWS